MLIKRSAIYTRCVLPIRDFIGWRRRGFTDYAPQFVKMRILAKHGVPDAQWVETGTYPGETTRYLAQMSPSIYTTEPVPGLYASAVESERELPVQVIDDASESAFPELLPRLKGHINFGLMAIIPKALRFLGKRHVLLSRNLTQFPVALVISGASLCSLMIFAVSSPRQINMRIIPLLTTLLISHESMDSIGASSRIFS